MVHEPGFLPLPHALAVTLGDDGVIEVQRPDKYGLRESEMQTIFQPGSAARHGSRVPIRFGAPGEPPRSSPSKGLTLSSETAALDTVPLTASGTAATFCQRQRLNRDATWTTASMTSSTSLSVSLG